MKSTRYILYCLIILLLHLLTIDVYAQQPISKEQVDLKGRFFVYWGWNWSRYTKSDIHVVGTDYDFTLSDVVAKDRPFAWSIENYFHPEKLTIPQTNFGIGYYFNDQWSISANIDHMKYVVQQNQWVTINGTIDVTDSPYSSTYQSAQIRIQPDFFRMEHTDGLNYVVTELSHTNNLFQKIDGLKNKVELNFIKGVGIGGIVPRSAVVILNRDERNKYRLAGFGTSVKAEVQLGLFRRFYFSYLFKGGYLNLLKVRTSNNKSDKAHHDFFFLAHSFQFGGLFHF